MRRQVVVNAALVALALGTLGVVWATREAPTTAELASRKGKLLPTFDKDHVTRLRIAKGADEVVLEADAKAPGEFRIVKPWSERADIATVNRLLGALDLASSLRDAEGVSNEISGLSPEALSIRVESGPKAQLVRLGGPAPSPSGAKYAEVAVEGVAHRYVVTEGVASELSVRLDEFREPLMLEYGRSELRRISIERGTDRVALEQRERGEFFASFPGGPELASREVVDRVITALSRLSADRFIAPEVARQSLFGGGLKVEIEPSGPEPAKVTLSFGNSCPDAPERVLLLREQAGRPPRAGCVPNDVLLPLQIQTEALRLSSPFAARSDEVEELRVRRGDKQYVLLRKEAGFRLRSPTESDVPLDTGNERISAILQAVGERQPAPDRAGLGLAPAQGELFVQVTSSDATRREERALLGARRPDGSVCLERALDRVVLCFPPEIAGRFEPDATLLRPLGLLSFAPSELATFTTVTKDLRQTVARQGDGTYRMLEPSGYAHDGSLVADAVQTLGTLAAARWVSLEDEPRFGLDKPQLSVRFTLTSDAPTRELTVGAETEGGYFARLSPDPAIFLLSKSAFGDLSFPLIDRALCPFEGDDLKGAWMVSSTGRDGGFSRASASSNFRTVFPSHASEASGALRSLKAYRVLHLGKALPNEGFTKPRLRITYSSLTRPSVEVLIGSCDQRDELQFCYARRSDVDATFALSFRVVNDLLAATRDDF